MSDIQIIREPVRREDKLPATRGEVKARIAVAVQAEAQKRSTDFNSLLKGHEDSVAAMHAFAEAMHAMHTRANEFAFALTKLSTQLDALEARMPRGRWRRACAWARDAWWNARATVVEWWAHWRHGGPRP